MQEHSLWQFSSCRLDSFSDVNINREMTDHINKSIKRWFAVISKTLISHINLIFASLMIIRELGAAATTIKTFTVPTLLRKGCSAPCWGKVLDGNTHCVHAERANILNEGFSCRLTNIDLTISSEEAVIGVVSVLQASSFLSFRVKSEGAVLWLCSFLFPSRSTAHLCAGNRAPTESWDSKTEKPPRNLE